MWYRGLVCNVVLLSDITHSKVDNLIGIEICYDFFNIWVVCMHEYDLFSCYILVFHTCMTEDRAERYDLKSRLWLFFSPFLFPPKKQGERKGEWIGKIVILSHAFMLDLYREPKIKDWMVFSKTFFFNFKISCVSTQFKHE